MTNSEELAVGAIKTIYDLWNIDASCMHWVGDTSAKTILSEGYGFDWWPGDFKVAVRVSGPHPEIDYPLYRLSVRTDFLCDVDVTTVKFNKILSDLNRWAPTFAMCAHPSKCRRASETAGCGRWRRPGRPCRGGNRNRSRDRSPCRDSSLARPTSKRVLADTPCISACACASSIEDGWKS